MEAVVSRKLNSNRSEGGGSQRSKEQRRQLKQTQIQEPDDPQDAPLLQPDASSSSSSAAAATMPPPSPKSSLSSSVSKLRQTSFAASLLVVERHSREAKKNWCSAAAVARHGKEWRWMATVSYWISASFAIGSLLFITGGVASIVADVSPDSLAPWQVRALVTYAYFAGGTYFTIGAYLGWFSVINIGEEKLQFCDGPDGGYSDAAFFGSFIYFVGAVAFQIAVIVGVFVPNADHTTALVLEYGAQAFGGLCFFVASCIEFHHNKHATWHEHVFWLCATYNLGSFLFFVAATAGFVKALIGLDALIYLTPLSPSVGEHFSMWFVDLPYAVGSFAFWVGALVQYQMWKDESFGLGFLSEINRELASIKRKLSTQTRGEGGQHLQWTSTIWAARLSIMTTTLYATLAVLNIGLVIAWHGTSEGSLSDGGATEFVLVGADEICHMIASLVASHTLLLLATVLQSTPTLHPFDYLTYLLRILELLFCASEAMTTLKLLAGYDY